VCPPEEDDVILLFFPLTHEFEEEIGLSDEEFEDPNEFGLPFVLPTHKDKEMAIFSHTDSLMK
jgi:hypothetical protein